MNAKGIWKRVINEVGDVLVEGNIVGDSNLYVVYPVYFVNSDEALHVDMAMESGKDRVPFAGMADVVEESLEEQYERQKWEWWYSLHSTPIPNGCDPIEQVRRVACRD